MWSMGAHIQNQGMIFSSEGPLGRDVFSVFPHFFWRDLRGQGSQGWLRSKGYQVPSADAPATLPESPVPGEPHPQVCHRIVGCLLSMRHCFHITICFCEIGIPKVVQLLQPQFLIYPALSFDQHQCANRRQLIRR